MTHTAAGTNQPWWQVDLGASANISSIDLFNRTDNCCTFRLADVVVFVSDTDMTFRTLAQLEADPSVTAYSVDGMLGVNTMIDTAASGQYVRVQLRGNPGTLSLAEVQVNGNFQ